MLPDDIIRIGKAFRLAFEQVDLSDAPGFLPHFPEGCCSWATWMVGHYFKNECGLFPKEVQGTRDDAEGTSCHAWLLVGGVVVDITCDQYQDCKSSIVTLYPSAWHAQWSLLRTEEIRPIGFHDSGPIFNRIPASIVYEQLRANVLVKLHSQ